MLLVTSTFTAFVVAPVAAQADCTGTHETITLTGSDDGRVIENEYATIRFRISSGETLSDVTIRNNCLVGDPSSSVGAAIDGYYDGYIDGTLSNVVVTNNHFVIEEDVYGIYWELDDSNDDLSDISITDNRFDDGSGSMTIGGDANIKIYVNGGSVTNLDISGNEMYSYYQAVYLDGRVSAIDTLTVTGNSVFADEEGVDINLDYLDGSSITGVQVLDNSIDSGSYGVELYLYGDGGSISDASVLRNDIDSTDGGYGDEGVYIDITSGTSSSVTSGGITGVTVSENTIDADGDGIYAIVDTAFDGSGITVADNDISASSEGMELNIEVDATLDSVDILRNDIADTGQEGIDLEVYGSTDATNLRVAGNLVDGAGTSSYPYSGVAIDVGAVGTLDLTVERNQFTTNTRAGVQLTSRTDATGVTVSENNIVGNAIGVENLNLDAVVDARNNWWGTETGPGSVGTVDLEDPVSAGVLANGTGDTVTEGSTSGVSNVRFAAFASSAFDISAAPTPPGGGDDGGTDSDSGSTSSPARFAVVESSISPGEVEVGENVTVTVTVENTGGRTGTYIGLLTADSRLIETQEPRIAPGETATLTYEFSLDERGGYDLKSRTWYLGRVIVTPLREPSATIEVDELRPNRVVASIRDPQPGTPFFLVLPFTEQSEESGVHLDNLNVTVDRRTDVEVDIEQFDRPLDNEPPVAGGTREVSFFTINVESEGNVTEAGFTFTIEKRLYEEFSNETNPAAGTALFRYDPEAGAWERYEMELVGETDSTYRFRVSTPGFSTFAVGTAGAEFDLRDVRLASETITAGDDAHVRATVANNGDRNGTYTAVLQVDGDRRTSQDVFVPADESRDVQLSESFQEPGEYAISLNNVSAGTLTVEAAATPTPTSTPEPTPTPTDEPEPTDTPTDEPEPTETEPDDETPATASDGQPGFALVTALLALLGAALLFARRRN